jgi:di/tricarboxylate transporter
MQHLGVEMIKKEKDKKVILKIRERFLVGLLILILLYWISNLLIWSF